MSDKGPGHTARSHMLNLHTQKHTETHSNTVTAKRRKTCANTWAHSDRVQHKPLKDRPPRSTLLLQAVKYCKLAVETDLVVLIQRHTTAAQFVRG